MIKKSEKTTRKIGRKASKLATILLSAATLNPLTPTRLMNHSIPQETQLPYGIPMEIWYDPAFGAGLRDPPRDYCEAYNTDIVTSEFIKYIIEIESAGNPNAKSKKGAKGKMQIMPPTWAEQTEEIYGKPLPFHMAYDPIINTKVGTHYLAKTIPCHLSQKLPVWTELAIEEQQNLIAAAYNGGMTKLTDKFGKIEKMPLESREYVKKLEDRREANQRQYASALE